MEGKMTIRTMVYLIILTILLFIIAGCSSTPQEDLESQREANNELFRCYEDIRIMKYNHAEAYNICSLMTDYSS